VASRLPGKSRLCAIRGSVRVYLMARKSMAWAPLFSVTQTPDDFRANFNL
jgi:hypothetical protein